MKKRILLTGATDGIGLGAAQALAQAGHDLVLHGRNESKLESLKQALPTREGQHIDTVRADLSSLSQTRIMAETLAEHHAGLDVIINNAGIFRTSDERTEDGLDIRIAVNTIAPYIIASRLVDSMPAHGRIVNISSAAQAAFQPAELLNGVISPDGRAYAVSKLALMMWTNHMASERGSTGPVCVSVNPGSFLGTKMVKEAYGMDGHDVGIGSGILVDAALSDEFSDATGTYWDNDARRFGSPHPDALDSAKCAAVVEAMTQILDRAGS